MLKKEEIVRDTKAMNVNNNDKLLPDDDEGPIGDIKGPVERIFNKDSEIKIGVAIAPFAQMFFLYKKDKNFDGNFKSITDALDSKSVVQCRVRRYSGRIISVTVDR